MNEHIENLLKLRDLAVEDRRALTSSLVSDPETARIAAGDMMFVQGLIDAIAIATSHERNLARPSGAWPAKPMAPPVGR